MTVKRAVVLMTLTPLFLAAATGSGAAIASAATAADRSFPGDPGESDLAPQRSPRESQSSGQEKKQCKLQIDGGVYEWHPHGSRIKLTTPNGAVSNYVCNDGIWEPVRVTDPGGGPLDAPGPGKNAGYAVASPSAVAFLLGP
jgi:hypothetical protein